MRKTLILDKGPIINMKKLFTTILIACMIFALAGCSSTPVGYWQIEKVVAGDVVMTQEDA